MSSLDRIDTHFHLVLDCYVEALKNAGGDPSGWVAPPWTPQDALKVMDTWDIKKSVLSITSPGPCIAGSGEAGRKLTRQINEETADICKANPDRFAFFASMPSFVDVDGAIAEAEYALKNLGAAGVVVMTSYDDKLLGDASFQPVWDKLNDLNAIVFIHPASVNIKPKHIAGKLPQPTIDYPVATTRTAVDLVMTRTFAKRPNLEIILSHAGGTLPFLADRVIKSLDIAQVADAMRVTAKEAQDDFHRFYLDVAVSTSKAQLNGLLDFTTPDKILFGSDWPYAPFEFGAATTKQFDEFCKDDVRGKQLAGVNRKNANKLFGW